MSVMLKNLFTVFIVALTYRFNWFQPTHYNNINILYELHMIYIISYIPLYFNKEQQVKKSLNPTLINKHNIINFKMC